MAAKKKKAVVEWVGGIVTLPSFVTGEGEPYRPEAIVWLGPEGAVLGTTVEKPGEVLEKACESLQNTFEKPMYGRPHAPTRVRVASSELASVLRAGHPSIEVTCAPTPEVDEMLAAMRESFATDEENTYLSSGTQPEAIASFFRAAASLYRSEPWALAPSDDNLVAVTIEKLGLREAVVSYVGHAGEVVGFALFSSIDDFGAYLEASESFSDRDEEAPTMPHHFALIFEQGANLDPALRKEILANGWEVAGPNAFPFPSVIDTDLVTRFPSARELTIAEAIARAQVELLKERDAVAAAFESGTPISRTFTVSTFAGELEVSLRVPCEGFPERSASPVELLESLADLTERGELGRERWMLDEEILRRFRASPEAQGVPDHGHVPALLDHAASYLGETVATLRSADLEKLLFEIFPRKLSVEASEAGAIIEETRAFYFFLEREFGLGQARPCLKVMAGNAVEELKARLSNPQNFGPAKSAVMAGRRAGFDMSTREGIEAWLEATQGATLSPVSEPPGQRTSTPASPEAKAKKKAKRKAAAKARKRNR